MYDVMSHETQAKEWQRIYQEVENGNAQPGFGQVFNGYVAAVDAPACDVWRLVLKQYPEVKVGGTL
jgi:hypothetical protein